MTDPERKRVMLFIASGYKLLAERAELRVRKDELEDELGPAGEPAVHGVEFPE